MSYHRSVSDVTIFHNRQCSSSRKAMAWLQGNDVDAEVVEYLSTPLDRDGLDKLLDALEGPAADLVRHDKRFHELGLDPADYTERAAIIDLLVEHPELMQRPVVVRGDKAVIARPPEATLDDLFG